VIENSSKYYEKEGMFHGSVPHVMGTRFDVLIIHSDQSLLNSLWKRIIMEMEMLDKMLNRFDSDSETSHINANAALHPVDVTESMWTVLQYCSSFYNRTMHLFDVTLGHFSNVELDESRSVRFKSEGVSLDFGGFAKGYALLRIQGILSEEGISQAFIDFGNSSLMGIGHHPYGDCWKVSLVNPYNNLVVDEFSLKDSSMSTSGNSPQKTKHIFHPINKLFNDEKKLSTIVADNPLDAEILSTVWMIADEEQQHIISNNFNNIQAKVYQL